MTERKMRKTLLSSIPIETERLILRYITADDAYDMFEYASIPEVSQYLLWSPHINLEATEGYIEFLQKRYYKGLFADWAVVLKESNKMIGTCGYASINASDGTCEIGYVLSPLYRGKGYMSEAVSAVLHLAFDTLELSEVSLRIISENLPSIKLAKRLGFNYERTSEMNIKDINRKVEHYIMTDKEYFSKKK